MLLDRRMRHTTKAPQVHPCCEAKEAAGDGREREALTAVSMAVLRQEPGPYYMMSQRWRRSAVAAVA